MFVIETCPTINKIHVYHIYIALMHLYMLLTILIHCLYCSHSIQNISFKTLKIIHIAIFSKKFHTKLTTNTLSNLCHEQILSMVYNY